MGVILFPHLAFHSRESISPLFLSPFLRPPKHLNTENRLGQDVAAAVKTIHSPYAEFIQILAASILPIFETFAVSSSLAGAPGALETTPRPSSPGDAGSTATAGGGSSGGGGDVAVDGGSLAGGSLASESVAGQSDGGGSGGGPSSAAKPAAAAADSIASGGDESVAPSQPSELLLRVFELETAESSEAEADAETARLLLPEPAAPAPDPKMLAIPADKVRQQVRRPVPRVQRQPLITLLEILSALPEDPSPPSSRPGSRNASAKARVERVERVESKAKDDLDQPRQQLGGDGPTQDKDGGDDEEVARAPSGAVGENPYRWVVSSASNASVPSRSGSSGREVAGMAAGSTHLKWLSCFFWLRPQLPRFFGAQAGLTECRRF